MKSVKGLIRNSTAGTVTLNISDEINYDVGNDFDRIADLIYWSLLAPLINNF